MPGSLTESSVPQTSREPDPRAPLSSAAPVAKRGQCQHLPVNRVLAVGGSLVRVLDAPTCQRHHVPSAGSHRHGGCGVGSQESGTGLSCAASPMRFLVIFSMGS